MRFNQPFGDTVNWDLIPDIAIDRLNLEGSNPVFGLNALGGAVNVQLKNGFTYQGAEATRSGGSFGKVQGEFQYGKQIGNVVDLCRRQRAARGRLARPAIVRPAEFLRRYRLARRDSRAAPQHRRRRHSMLNGPGTSPVELLAADPRAQFTAPNLIANKYGAISLNGIVDINDTTSVQAARVLSLFPAARHQRQRPE